MKYFFVVIVTVVLIPEIVGGFVILKAWFEGRVTKGPSWTPIEHWWEYLTIPFAMYYVGYRGIRYGWYTLRGAFNRDWLFVRDHG
jgi:hypothetical protein